MERSGPVGVVENEQGAMTAPANANLGTRRQATSQRLSHLFPLPPPSLLSLFAARPSCARSCRYHSSLSALCLRPTARGLRGLRVIALAAIEPVRKALLFTERSVIVGLPARVQDLRWSCRCRRRIRLERALHCCTSRHHRSRRRLSPGSPAILGSPISRRRHQDILTLSVSTSSATWESPARSHSD